MMLQPFLWELTDKERGRNDLCKTTLVALLKTTKDLLCQEKVAFINRRGATCRLALSTCDTFAAPDIWKWFRRKKSLKSGSCNCANSFYSWIHQLKAKDLLLKTLKIMDCTQQKIINRPVVECDVSSIYWWCPEWTRYEIHNAVARFSLLLSLSLSCASVEKMENWWGGSWLIVTYSHPFLLVMEGGTEIHCSTISGT